MTKCWAEKLDGCAEKASKEHIISAGIFPEGIIRVKGFPWCKDEFREISVASFTRKVLCQHHNNILTDVDAAGIKAIEAFRQERQIRNAREKTKHIRWTVKRIHIDGRGLERWFLKTLINMTVGGPYRIGTDSIEVGKPSERLVKIAFGLETFKPRAGLYGLGHAGQNLILEEGVLSMPLVNKKDILVGMLFHFHGYRFLLYLEDEGLNQTISIPSMFGEQAHYTDTLYSLKALRFTIGKHLSHVIELGYKT